MEANNVTQVTVNKLVSDWVERMGLDGAGWEIRVNCQTPLQNAEAVAEVATEWEYLQATIFVNLTEAGRFTRDELERVIVHELAHVLLAPMAPDESSAMEEFVATSLANAFLRVRENSWGGDGRC